MRAWVLIGVVGACPVALKGLGPLVIGGRSLPRPLLGVVALLAPTLLAALIVIQAFADGRHLVVDARAAGLVVALVAVLLRSPVLVVVVMAQLVLSGGLFELQGQTVLQQIAWLFPTRWGLAAGASTVDLQSMIPFKDALWEHTTGAWWRSVFILVLQIAALIGLARLALRRLEPGRQ